MESLEFNKAAGALLGACMLTMGLGIVSNMAFYRAKPAQPGYDLPAAVESTEPAPGSAAPAEPLPVLLAKADAAKGQTYAKACATCHNFEKGAAAKVGPPLYGVVGREVASIPGFDYSAALKQKGGAWDYQKISEFIADPKRYANGTKMAFAGEKDAQHRADIEAYLRTLSDNPVPFPTADASPAPTPTSTNPATPESATPRPAGAPAPTAPGVKPAAPTGAAATQSGANSSSTTAPAAAAPAAPSQPQASPPKSTTP